MKDFLKSELLKAEKIQNSDYIKEFERIYPNMKSKDLNFKQFSKPVSLLETFKKEKAKDSFYFEF